jgi:hypothetical protein
MRQVLGIGTSGHSIDDALTIFVTIEDQCIVFKSNDTWRRSGDRTLGRLHPVNPTGVSGRPVGGTVKSLTALFFGDAYK